MESGRSKTKGKQENVRKESRLDLYAVKSFRNRDVVQTEVQLQCASGTWTFQGCKAFSIGRRGLGDPHVFGRRTWGATRGGNLAVMGKALVVCQRGVAFKKVQMRSERHIVHMVRLGASSHASSLLYPALLRDHTKSPRPDGA